MRLTKEMIGYLFPTNTSNTNHMLDVLRGIDELDVGIRFNHTVDKDSEHEFTLITYQALSVKLITRNIYYIDNIKEAINIIQYSQPTTKLPDINTVNGIYGVYKVVSMFGCDNFNVILCDDKNKIKIEGGDLYLPRRTFKKCDDIFTEYQSYSNLIDRLDKEGLLDVYNALTTGYTPKDVDRLSEYCNIKVDSSLDRAEQVDYKTFLIPEVSDDYYPLLAINSALGYLIKDMFKHVEYKEHYTYAIIRGDTINLPKFMLKERG